MLQSPRNKANNSWCKDNFKDW